MRASYFLLILMMALYVAADRLSRVSLPHMSISRDYNPLLPLKGSNVQLLSCKVMRLSGGGNTMGSADGEAITEEQAGEELIKAASVNNVDGLDPPGIEILVSSGAPVNYQVDHTW